MFYKILIIHNPNYASYGTFTGVVYEREAKFPNLSPQPPIEFLAIRSVHRYIDNDLYDLQCTKCSVPRVNFKFGILCFVWIPLLLKVALPSLYLCSFALQDGSPVAADSSYGVTVVAVDGKAEIQQPNSSQPAPSPLPFTI
jgi:hypothetical protein